MKKLILLIVILFTTLTIYSQESKYESLKSISKLQGYTIGKQMYLDIAQDEMFYNDITFWEGYEYQIIACSDNDNVLDIDLYLFDMNQNLLLKDTEEDDMAGILFEVKGKRNFRIVIKNCKSTDPYIKNTVQFYIAYKKIK